jgi:hypothetical protein
MKVIHVMADGSTRDSVDGLVIKSPQFYQVLNTIQRKKTVHKETRK